jgi:Zn finger protein HypA/HybF involved in hydrogenase expression
MYVYFKLTNSVLTCEEYPQILSVEKMKSNNLENMCNKWEKFVSEDGTFTLSFRYKKPVCDCDNSQYIYYDDYANYECYNCGTRKTSFKDVKEGDNLYLQNSGSIDIVCVKPINNCCQLCEINGYPNVYKWISYDDNLMFALHIQNGMLSDEDISNKINIIQENCHIIFTEYV